MKRTKRINLMVTQSKVGVSKISPDLLIVSGAVFLGILLVTMAVTQVRYKARVTAENQQLKAETEKLERDAQELLAKSGAAKGDQRDQMVADLKSREIRWSTAFKELSLLIPRESWLIYLMVENEKGKPKVVLKGEAPSQLQVAQFFSALNRSEYFTNTIMRTSELLNDFNPTLYRFQFETFGTLQQKSSKEAKNGKDEEISFLSLLRKAIQ